MVSSRGRCSGARLRRTGGGGRQITRSANNAAWCVAPRAADRALEGVYGKRREGAVSNDARTGGKNGSAGARAAELGGSARLNRHGRAPHEPRTHDATNPRHRPPFIPEPPRGLPPLRTSCPKLRLAEPSLARVLQAHCARQSRRKRNGRKYGCQPLNDFSGRARLIGRPIFGSSLKHRQDLYPARVCAPPGDAIFARCGTIPRRRTASVTCKD